MISSIYTEGDIRSLIGRFENRNLPKAEWTHAAHLVVAVWYVTHHGFDKAMPLVRGHITGHNESVGTPNTDTEGYHETITRFWLWVTAALLERDKPLSLEAACHQLISSDTGRSGYPLVYYSRERLFSTEARHRWVTPDLHPLDRLLP